MSDGQVGEIVGTGENYRIATALRIAASIQEVWDTATRSDRIGWWFAPGEVGAEGGDIQLNFPDGKFGMSGKVKVLFAPFIFEFTWDAEHRANQPTIVRFDFIEAEKGVTEARVTSLTFNDLPTTCMILATWRFMLERLAQAIKRQQPIPEDEERVTRLTSELQGLYASSNL